MSKIEIFAQQLNIKNDIQSANGFEGVDQLNKLKEKYKTITSSFSSVIKGSPFFMENFTKTRGSELFLMGLFEKFDRNNINISVVAEVSSGKSTFLNALIFGKKVLDAKMGETTAKVFKISYGENENLETLTKKIKEINIKTKDNISQEHFDVKNIKIDDYIVDLKAENKNLKKGIVLYDTPGFGTLNERVMSKLIAEAVNRSDAVILLLDISKGLKKDEARFIEEALSYIKENKRFIVLNKFDATFDEDDDMDEIQEQIDKVVEDTKRDLSKMSQEIDKSVLDKQTYYLSATKALTGKFKNKQDVLKGSRFPIFEDSFWNRIVEAKKEIFADGVNSLLNEASLAIEEAELKKDSFNQIIKQTNTIVEHIENVSDEIKELVNTHSQKIEKVAKETTLNTTIVFDKSSILENSMDTIIKDSVQYEINKIPNENIKDEHFKTASANIIQTINNEFLNLHKELVKDITTDITEKESNVNKVIDSLNKSIKSENFQKLDLKMIARVEFKISNAKAINLNNDSNEVNITKESSDSFQTMPIVRTVIRDAINSVETSGSEGLIETGGISEVTAGLSLGAGLGATIGSVVPVVGTTIGGAIGSVVGALAGWIGGDSGEQKAKHKREMEEMQRQHQENIQKMTKDMLKIAEDMQKMKEENHKRAVEENYRRAIKEAKNDFSNDMQDSLKEQIYKHIAKKRTVADNEYRIILSEITSTIHNAQNILKDMQTIIEDPSEQKRIITDNNAKIKDIDKFISNIEKCFRR